MKNPELTLTSAAATKKTLKTSKACFLFHNVLIKNGLDYTRDFLCCVEVSPSTRKRTKERSMNKKPLELLSFKRYQDIHKGAETDFDSTLSFSRNI
jgi:hypothetical protein